MPAQLSVQLSSPKRGISTSFTFSLPLPKATYSYGGNTYNSSGYLANPSRNAQIRARDAGALTNYEASSMGLPNRR